MIFYLNATFMLTKACHSRLLSLWVAVATKLEFYSNSPHWACPAYPRRLPASAERARPRQKAPGHTQSARTSPALSPNFGLKKWQNHGFTGNTEKSFTDDYIEITSAPHRYYCALYRENTGMSTGPSRAWTQKCSLVKHASRDALLQQFFLVLFFKG